MEEKKYVKISLGTAIAIAIMFILIICALIFGFYYYNLNNEKQNESLSGVNNNVNENEENDTLVDEEEEQEHKTENNNEISILKLGVYTTNEIEVTPDPETYGIHDITLENESDFSINMPLGTSYKGTYKIEGNNLICNATKEEFVEGGNSATSDVTIEFEFEILNDSKLKFKKVSNKDFELTLGMTYAIENETENTETNNLLSEAEAKNLLNDKYELAMKLIGMSAEYFDYSESEYKEIKNETDNSTYRTYKITNFYDVFNRYFTNNMRDYFYKNATCLRFIEEVPYLDEGGGGFSGFGGVEFKNINITENSITATARVKVVDPDFNVLEYVEHEFEILKENSIWLINKYTEVK